MSTVVHVLGDDWCGVYLNGRLVAENHSIRALDWLEVVRGLGHHSEQIEVDQEWLESLGTLPEKLGDVHIRRATQ